MKILIIGFGSIGKRHAQILAQIKGVEIAVLRSLKGTLKEKSPFKEFYNVEDALAFQPNGVIISNPTALHVDYALKFSDIEAKLLIEKPISHSVSDAERLESFSKNIRVAYCLRFLPFYKTLYSILENETVVKMNFKRSFYLPKWHPYADYREEYTAKKSLGGGVIRTLSHEIDLMVHFFGKPQSVIGTTDKLSDLNIDTDDFAFFSCKYTKGFRVNFELDFLSPQNINEGELITSKGRYIWNMKNFHYTDYENTETMDLIKPEMFNIEIMYQSQMLDFVNFINSSLSINATLEESIVTLKIIEQVEK